MVFSPLNLSRDWTAGQKLKMWDALYVIAEPNTSGVLNSLLAALKLWQLPHVQWTNLSLLLPSSFTVSYLNF